MVCPNNHAVFGAISCIFQRKVVYLQKTFWMMAKCSSLRTTEDRSYEGHVSLISEDVDTKEEIEVNGISDEVL